MALQLAIDIGNSRTKLGVFKFRNLVDQKVVNNDDLNQFSSFIPFAGIDGLIISSVNREAEKNLNLSELKCTQVRLSDQLPLPFKMEYETPETLGKDRIAAVAGAMKAFPTSNLLVIDAGSCITYDFLTADYRYLGGAISPGLQMRLKAMHQLTDALPLIQWEGSELPQMIGKSTISSMLSGAINGAVGEIKSFITTYQRQYNELKIVLTGGDANLFEIELKNGIFADPNLVLKGLNEILIYNRD